MAKKSSGSKVYSPDGWFLKFLILMVLIAGIVAATAQAQRRQLYENKAAVEINK